MIRIRQLASEGQSIRQISRTMDIARNTVRKHLRSIYEADRAKSAKPSKLDGYRDFIDKQVEGGNYNCENILLQIQRIGYTGKISILKDYVRPQRPAKRMPAVMRFETAPGQQAQMDWGIVYCIDDRGMTRKLPALVIVLGNSRAMYAEFTSRCDEDSLTRCMVNSFEYFGGVPREVLTDRMKTVLTAYGDKGPVWHRRFEDFAAVMGFIPKVCRARRPQTKGKVERGVRFLKESFLPGRCFTNLEELNGQVRHWCDTQNNRIHGSTGEVPFRKLEQENLLPLPSAEVRSAYRWQTRKVSKDGFISYEGVFYGVPWQYSGKEVNVRIAGACLEIWCSGTLAASHRKESVSGKIVWLEGQYRDIPDAGNNIGAAMMARMVEQHKVEDRPLSAYAAFAEVAYD